MDRQFCWDASRASARAWTLSRGPIGVPRVASQRFISESSRVGGGQKSGIFKRGPCGLPPASFRKIPKLFLLVLCSVRTWQPRGRERNELFGSFLPPNVLFPSAQGLTPCCAPTSGRGIKSLGYLGSVTASGFRTQKWKIQTKSSMCQKRSKSFS